MRLAQFARKHGITQSQIVELLKEKNEAINENGNAKLNDKQISLLFTHFNLNTEEKIEAEGNPAQYDQVDDIVMDDQKDNTELIEEYKEVEEPLEDEKEPVNADTLIDSSTEVDVNEENTEETLEIIRAKKVKLDGIKVVGKINLPEKPVKEEETGEDKAFENNEKTKKKRPSIKKKQPKKRSALSYEEKRKREALRLKKKKERREEILKEKKRRYYQQVVQPKAKPNNVKVKKKSPKEKLPERKSRPVYKNPIRRIWAWLNGEYDQ